MKNCDPVTGICTPSSLEELKQIGLNSSSNQTEIIYIGDPMCSWCWGISPALIQLRNHFSKNMAFRIVVGGLRPGGGDPWNNQMKGFLKHHWEEVNKKSGQPFGYDLFDLKTFNYNTEPACRAIIAARPFVKYQEMEFFESIQQKFYVHSQDPNTVDFYESICEQFNVDYAAFKMRFESDEVRMETIEEFNLNRQWGVTGFPAVILNHNNRLISIVRGFSTFPEMKNRVEKALLQAS